MVGKSTPAQRSDADPEAGRGVDGRRLTRYDLLLGVIPVAFMAGALVAEVTGVPYRVALPAAASVGVFALVDGLFLNPPRRPPAGNGPA